MRPITLAALVVLLLVYIRGLFLDVMDVDASQYASIAMEMLQNGSWLEVMHRGKDYLDKPPLLFWASAASYKLFGFGNFAYKIPSFLAAMLGVYALWQFALLYYDKKTARHAALIFFSAQALILISNDVRTDTLLLGFGTVAVWQMAAYLKKKALRHLIWGFLAAGVAMLAKGPIGLVMPGFAVGTHLLLQRNWKGIFRGQWILGITIAGVVLLPMCWGLYTQFDLHPEKTVNDRQGVSGLHFFFWEQSFGRVTGENIWKNDTGPLYFVHTYLWAFLPWSLLFIGAFFTSLKSLFQSKLKLEGSGLPEGYSIGAFLLTFIALSTSKYKLPHYIFITLPWAAILTAHFIEGLFSQKVENQKANNDGDQLGSAFWPRLHELQLAVMLFVAGLLIVYVFPQGNNAWFIGYLGLLGLLTVHFFQKKNTIQAEDLIQSGLIVMASVGVILNFFFYPRLLAHQGTAKALQYANEIGLDRNHLYLHERHAHTMDVYARRILPDFESLDKTKPIHEETVICTNRKGLLDLEKKGYRCDTLAGFPQYQVALLKPDFLNPATRERTLERIFLVKIKAKTSDLN